MVGVEECQHHWIIATNCIGKCKKCGKAKRFAASIDTSREAQGRLFMERKAQMKNDRNLVKEKE